MHRPLARLCLLADREVTHAQAPSSHRGQQQAAGAAGCRRTRGCGSWSSRFVAGTTLEEAIEVTKELNARRIDVSLDLLGETVEDLQRVARAATEAYIEAVQAIARAVPRQHASR